MNIVMRQGWMALGVSIAAMIGSGMLVRSIPYQTGPSAKQAAWLLHCAVIGAVVAPICALGAYLPNRIRYFLTDSDPTQKNKTDPDPDPGGKGKR